MKKSILALVFLLLGCRLALAQAEPIEAVLDRLQAKMAGINRIQSDFNQEKNLAMFKQKLVLKGRITIQKPGMLSWKVNSPMRYGLVIKNGLVSQWDQDSGQIQSVSMEKNPGIRAAIEQMQNWFAGTYKSMLLDYQVSLVQEEPLKLEFVPKANSMAANFIQKVMVTFESDSQYIKEMYILEKNGDSSLMEFTGTRINQDIDPRTWDVKSAD